MNQSIKSNQAKPNQTKSSNQSNPSNQPMNESVSGTHRNHKHTKHKNTQQQKRRRTPARPPTHRPTDPPHSATCDTHASICSLQRKPPKSCPRQTATCQSTCGQPEGQSARAIAIAIFKGCRENRRIDDPIWLVPFVSPLTPSLKKKRPPPPPGHFAHACCRCQSHCQSGRPITPSWAMGLRSAWRQTRSRARKAARSAASMARKGGSAPPPLFSFPPIGGLVWRSIVLLAMCHLQNPGGQSPIQTTSKESPFGCDRLAIDLSPAGLTCCAVALGSFGLCINRLYQTHG